MIAESKTARALIVEDDESWQEIYAEVLGPDGEGYEVVQVDNREDAITKLNAQQFDLVIVDRKLPKSPGEPEPKFEHGQAVVDYVSNLVSKPNRIWVITGYPLSTDVKHRLDQQGVKVAAKTLEDLNRLLAEVQRQVRAHYPTDIVMKFGGTSMGSSESISAVAYIVTQYVKRASVPCTVVVSAMSKVTDSLLNCAVDAKEGNLAQVQERLEKLRTRHAATATELVTKADLRQVYLAYLDKALEALSCMYQDVATSGETSLRDLDRISGYGERLSARLLAATLASRDVESTPVDATDVIVTDDVFGSATPLPDETNKKVEEVLKPLLERGVVPVATGFIASTSNGIPTTLGRGGSDYSATILGAALNAEEVWIWTDVTGIMDADPNLVSGAETITQISYEKAAELTYHGARVLHAKALAPVMGRRIPVRILNTFAPDEPGTLIGPSEDIKYRYNGSVLVSSSGLGLVTVSSDLNQSWTPTIGARALTALARNDIEVMGYSQSFSQRTLSITLRETDATRAASVLSLEFTEDIKQGRVQSISARGQVAAVSIIGGQQAHPALVGHFLTGLGAAGIEVLGVIEVPTENSFSVLMGQNALRNAVLVAHDAMVSARRTE